MMKKKTTITSITSSQRQPKVGSVRWILLLVYYFIICSIIQDLNGLNNDRNGNSNSNSIYVLGNNSNEFNDQIMPRIINVIDRFLTGPIKTIEEIAKLRDLGHTFTNGMTIADRESIINLLTMSVSLKTHWWIQDDIGTSIYPIEHPLRNVEIREPGNSGYKISDAQNPTSPYHKHYIACIDDSNGSQMNCTADVGTVYVQCVNDCELIPCPSDSDSHSESESTIESEYTNTTSVHQKADANMTTFCTNYVLKEVQPEEEGLLGYVPNTVLCINAFGQPEQRPGYVLQPDGTLGDCLYSDNVTIVNRTLSGPYESCGDTHLIGDTNINSFSNSTKVCNTTFTGGFSSYEWDGRYRPWYINARLKQKPVWSEPFIVWGENNIGIMYTIPYYNYLRIDNTTTTTTTTTTKTKTIETSLTQALSNANHDYDTLSKMYQKIFAGVLCYSNSFYEITEFLIKTYNKTDMKIMIVEENTNSIGTHYMVSTSTGREGKSIKTVLVSDPTQPCPTTDIKATDECTVERISIEEIGTKYTTTTSTSNTDTIDISDIVFYRAYKEHEKRNFPSDKNVNFKAISTDISSKAYVAQTQQYHLPNLHWRVFVIVPMDRSSNDSVTSTDPLFAVVCILSILGFGSCMTLFIQFYNKRTEKAVVNSDWRFTCAFIFGCSTLNLTSLTMLGENTNPLCMLRMWSFNAIFVCALSPLFVKVWRMAKLLNASAGFQRTNVTNFQAMLYTLPLISIELLILLIFSIVDPPRQTEELGVGIGIGVQQVTCEHNSNAFFITQTTYGAILLFIGCVLAYRTRDLNPKFGEAKQLGFSMYNIAFTAIVVVAVMNLVDLDQVSQIILQTVGVLWGSFFCSLAFVLPRLLEVSKERKNRESTLSNVSGVTISGMQIQPTSTDSGTSNRRRSRLDPNFGSSSLSSAINRISGLSNSSASIAARSPNVDATTLSSDKLPSDSFDPSDSNTVIEKAVTKHPVGEQQVKNDTTNNSSSKVIYIIDETSSQEAEPGAVSE